MTDHFAFRDAIYQASRGRLRSQSYAGIIPSRHPGVREEDPILTQNVQVQIPWGPTFFAK